MKAEVEGIVRTEAAILREATSSLSSMMVDLSSPLKEGGLDHMHDRGQQELQTIYEAKTKLLELTFDARVEFARYE
jgi:hypothetical protein